MAVIDYASQLRLTSQHPLDKKIWFKLLSEMYDYEDSKPFTYYDGLFAYCSETEKFYVWKELSGISSEENTLSFTYPVDWIVDGLDYSEKEYTFSEFQVGTLEVPLVDGLYEGSITWLELLKFVNTELLVVIGGNPYSVSESITVLNAADGSHPRLDIITALLVTIGTETLAQISFRTGVPSANPIKPVIPYNGIEIELTLVSVPAGATEPGGVTNIVMYDEWIGLPDEYTVSENSGAAGIELNNLEHPNTGIKNIKVDYSLLAANEIITMVPATDLNILSVNEMYLSIYIEKPTITPSKKATDPQAYIGITLFKSGIQVGSQVRLRNGKYGLNTSNLHVYQSIIIPISEFSFLSAGDEVLIDKIEYSFNEELGTKIFLDTFRLISGTIPAPSVNSILAHYDTPDTFVGHANKRLVVKSNELGVEFETIPDLPSLDNVAFVNIENEFTEDQLLIGFKSLLFKSTAGSTSAISLFRGVDTFHITITKSGTITGRFDFADAVGGKYFCPTFANFDLGRNIADNKWNQLWLDSFANVLGVKSVENSSSKFFASNGEVVDLQLTEYTVATLPATPTQGDTAFVTDATAPTYLAVLVGGGAVVCPVFYDGTNWVSY